MIPSIQDILQMLVKGECTQDQALQWIGSHIELATENLILRDTFASMASIGRDAQGNLLQGSVIAVMGDAKPPAGADALEALRWWCDAEARIRYAKAESMMKARVL